MWDDPDAHTNTDRHDHTNTHRDAHDHTNTYTDRGGAMSGAEKGARSKERCSPSREASQQGIEGTQLERGGTHDS